MIPPYVGYFCFCAAFLLSSYRLIVLSSSENRDRARLPVARRGEDADRLANDLDRAGQQAGVRNGDGFAEGIQRSSPKIQRSFNAIENATTRTRASLQRYNEMVNEGGHSTERAGDRCRPGCFGPAA